MDKMWITCRDCHGTIQFPDGFIPKEFYCIHCGHWFIPEEVRALIREAKQNGYKQ